jgi:hypothetical protein
LRGGPDPPRADTRPAGGGHSSSPQRALYTPAAFLDG